MPTLILNEIRKRLSAFARQWSHALREIADAKLFWARFYECFGIRPESSTIYEKSVSKLGGSRGFIDNFITGLLIVEHKSRGKNLDAAFSQAADYFLALPEAERPRTSLHLMLPTLGYMISEATSRSSALSLNYPNEPIGFLF